MRAEVRMVACMTLDGFIARERGEPPNQESAGGWTSPEDKREFWREVREADVIVCGRVTAKEMPDTGKPMMMLTAHPGGPEERAAHKVKWYVAPYFTDVRDWINDRAGRVLVCGGSMTYDFFLRWNLVDRAVLVVEPIMFKAGVPLTTDPGTRGGMENKFDLLKSTPLNARGTMRMDYVRAKSW